MSLLAPSRLPDMESILSEQGWCTFYSPGRSINDLEAIVLRIAHNLGTPLPTRKRGHAIDHLRPTQHKNAHPRSLSARYDLGEFPWHTDGAHWPTPPRYIVLACVEATEKSAKTIIRDAHSSQALNSEAARIALFRVSNGGNSFYATATSPLQNYYRFDPGCMSPVDVTAQQLQDAIEKENTDSTASIQWSPRLISIIDNWRCLHRRTNAKYDTTRHLLRATVME